MTRVKAATAVLAGTVLVLSACGDDGTTPTTPPPATVTVTATPETSPATPETSPAAPQTPSESQTSASEEVDLFTYLVGHRGYRDASGSAEYDADRGERQLEVDASGLSALAGQTISVFVGSTRVGTMAVSSAGRAHREWDTEHGDAVPDTSADDRVHVLTADRTVVLSGRFKVDLSD